MRFPLLVICTICLILSERGLVSYCYKLHSHQNIHWILYNGLLCNSLEQKAHGANLFSLGARLLYGTYIFSSFNQVFNSLSSAPNTCLFISSLNAWTLQTWLCTKVPHSACLIYSKYSIVSVGVGVWTECRLRLLLALCLGASLFFELFRVLYYGYEKTHC